MARSGEVQAHSSPAVVQASPSRRAAQADPALERELLQAMAEFERGEFIELTLEQLEHYAATGESPWPDESRS